MVGSKAWVIALFLGVSLAGCTSNENLDGTDSVDDAINNGGLGGGEILATGPPLLQLEDPWADADEVVLHDAAVKPGVAELNVGAPCFSLGGAYAAGCWSETTLENPIPVGTKTMRVEWSVESQGNNQFELFIETNERNGFSDDSARGAAKTGPELDWSIDMLAEEWQEKPWFGLWAAGAGGQHVTATHMKVTAIKDPDWVLPVVVDPWLDPSNHTLTDSGSMQLLDVELALERKGNTQGELIDGVEDVTPVRLANPVPPQTASLTIGIRTLSVSPCEPGHICYVDAAYYNGQDDVQTYEQDRVDAEETGDGWLVLTFSSELVNPDHPALPQSGTWLDAMALACPGNVDQFFGSRGSGFCTQNARDHQFTAQFLVEAWTGEPDLDAFKERLGV